MRLVSDSESIRRDNRALVLGALRNRGPQTRTQLTAETGLSSASVTAITQDMLAQGLLVDLPGEGRPDLRVRGRPAINLGFNRHFASLCLVEIDVSRARLSLVDYGGTLIDRIESNLSPAFFREHDPGQWLGDRIALLGERNPDEFGALRRIAISVQGILDPIAQSLRWSPIVGLAGKTFASTLADRFRAPVGLTKRGRLLAEGTRWLDPDLREASLATIFVGSTVAMGLSSAGSVLGRNNEGATEFGHMNHAPGGALCRCGMHGCIEAYASDYGVLRTAYSVPYSTPPAAHVPPAEYDELIRRAQRGDRNARHAFNVAGQALGFGIARLLSVTDPSHIFIAGPGAHALDLMRAEIDAALAQCFVGRVSGLPVVRALADESEPIFTGLMMQSLAELDQSEFAAMPAAEARA